MSLDYIRETYGVPAYQGQRVRYDGGDPHLGPKLGTITGSRNAHIRVRLDGEQHSRAYHPTWAMTYLDDSQVQSTHAGGNDA